MGIHLPPGKPLAPGASSGPILAPVPALALSGAALACVFVFGLRLGFGLSTGLSAVALLSFAASFFLTMVELPRDRPRLRAVAILILGLGGIAVILITPFGAMALAAMAVSR